ncbi:UPF0158 family protein [Methylonatrum kenyense]|uniref:UPF0158 family protein n=1 Tax=Methylonatrum kenyense TaxID=455253 RepID=UPI0020C16AD7|nr:UPF0158 family protein [Methylonatrum kenyense]MCK8514716.1 UPF0158 family protein [Methylonatrum kenyense]
MRKLQIEVPPFLEALDSGGLGITYYLDLQAGAVIAVFDDVDDDEDELRPAVDEAPERYRYIDPVDSHESYRWMEHFAHSIEEAEVRGRLLDALDRQRPFRRFKDALLSYPEVREAWFRSREERLRAYAEEWLMAEEIEAELVETRTVESDINRSG